MNNSATTKKHVMQTVCFIMINGPLINAGIMIPKSIIAKPQITLFLYYYPLAVRGVADTHQKDSV